MFINNDERINLKFLYRKPVVIGILDDSDNDPHDMSWMVDNSWELLKVKFTESSFQELVIGLVEIFRGGQPNYSSLGEMFGNDTKVEGDIEKVVYIITNIERNLNDIIRVEMYLDPMNRNINDLILYVREGLDMLTIKDTINEKYEGLSIGFNDKFIITDREYRIIIICE
ncbi:hypothetical protein GCM10010912_65830 [Paenibacillus albidus]|uniref:Uncharacterized protein n=1 Tax=Paenibacillus albidus TaxID=2041023 RepID=A0A917D849_9BACL|nr:hypothetical protein [Paenibacillus albidus]GGG12244.1 hypothetical protein GCM10010912_65830 [Paenibacillus albidus]